MCKEYAVTTTLLAVDVGGTKCELALYPFADELTAPIVQRRFPCHDFPGLEEIVSRFLDECGEHPSWASIDLAGVVSGDVGTVTNLPWKIESSALTERFGFSGVLLMNDMTALCASLPSLAGDDLLELQAGVAENAQAMAVVAPGTGLGEGMLIHTEHVFLPRGAEGGHSDFAPVGEEQLALLSWMLKHERRVSYEQLISGTGLPNVYDFCREYLRLGELEEIEAQMGTATDRTPLIFNGAFATPHSPACRRTVELFLEILGAEAGNVALKLYARGGLFIGGGILPRIADKADFSGFLTRFSDKGKMAGLLSTIPIHLILRSDAPLLGAAAYGLSTFR